MSIKREEQQQVIGNCSEYEMFRMKKINTKNDDDSLSAHFSNNHSNFTDREKDMDQQVQSKQSIKMFPLIMQIQLRKKLQQKETECENSQRKYRQLMEKYKQLQRIQTQTTKQLKFYKLKYQEKKKKDKQTKQKLQKWVHDVKTDLNEA